MAILKINFGRANVIKVMSETVSFSPTGTCYLYGRNKEQGTTLIA